MLTIIVLLLCLAWSLVLGYWITSAFVGFVRTRVPFVPSPAADIEFIAKETGIGPHDVFYELGSGNGRVVFLVEELTGAKAVGFELTGWTHLVAKVRLRLQRKKRKIEFYKKDFFKVPWTEATVIYCYLYPPLMGKIEEKFLAEMRPGSMAIIRDFPFPTLKPLTVYNRPYEHEIYVYRK